MGWLEEIDCRAFGKVIAKTPYQRVIESKHIYSAIKRKLKRHYEELNPAELKRNITKLQNKLIRLVTSKNNAKKKDNFVYNFHEATKKDFAKIFT